ncbi:hypothetical protein BH20ACT23_BH20ACT23_09430 [soil metagenome]
MGIGLSPSNPDRLYVIHSETLGFFEGFYVSNDGGDSWTKSPPNPLLENSQSSFGWWFGRVWVTPENADRVFVAGVPLMETTDGGLTWRFGAQGIHVDQHAMAWDDKVPNRIYLGNDGGTYRSDDNGASWVKATYEPYTQFYTIDVSEQDPSRIAGGTQDNGSNRTWNGEAWNEHYGDDGLENAINYNDQNIVYACFQYGNCAKSTNGGDTMRSFTSRTTSQRRNWMSPLEFDSNDPNVMYYGGNILNRTTDGGETWTAISPDLTGGPGRDTLYPYGRSQPLRRPRPTDNGSTWEPSTRASGGRPMAAERGSASTRSFPIAGSRASLSIPTTRISPTRPSPVSATERTRPTCSRRLTVEPRGTTSAGDCRTLR